MYTKINDGFWMEYSEITEKHGSERVKKILDLLFKEMFPHGFSQMYVLILKVEEKKNWPLTDNIHLIVKDHVKRNFYTFLTMYKNG